MVKKTIINGYEIEVAGNEEEPISFLGRGMNEPLNIDRPFDGQPQTFDGVRGSAKVSLRVRDIIDLLYKTLVILEDKPLSIFKMGSGTLTLRDISELGICEGSDVEVLGRKLGCLIEKMSGTYPNIPLLKDLGN